MSPKYEEDLTSALGAICEVLTRENLREYFRIEAQITKNTATGKQQIYYLPGWIKSGKKA